MKLTRRQKEILDFHFASLNAVFKHLEALESRGFLHRDSNRARSIQLSPEDPVGIQVLPLYGYVAAGQPIEAVSSPETLQVPDEFLPRRGNYYVLQVQGESMIDEHIQNGDYVIVESRETARPGEMVVALVDGDHVTLKKFYREGERIRLQPANEALDPIILEENRVKIQGVIVSVMRKYQ